MASALMRPLPSFPPTQSAKACRFLFCGLQFFNTGHQIVFAHTSFKWTNLASNNAGVTVAIVGISSTPQPIKGCSP